MAHGTLIGGTSYEISGGKTLVGGTGYEIEGGKTLVGGTGYDISFNSMPPIGTPLNDFTWEQIRAISDAGLSSTYFNVGDTKAVVLNGKLGQLTLSNFTVYAVIIGIDHNSALEGSNRIHFQLGTNDLAGSKNIAFIDSKLNYDVDSSGYFSMNFSASNAGGWESSQMRTNICGTSLTSDAGTIISVIPSELRSVLKSVTKYTNNVGKSSAAEAITATNDYFFLPSEFEVSGTRNKAHPSEQSMQQCYAYYISEDDRIKYNHKYSTSKVAWWTRSPYYYVDNRFLFIYNTGGLGGSGDPRKSYGFAPCFCV